MHYEQRTEILTATLESQNLPDGVYAVKAPDGYDDYTYLFARMQDGDYAYLGEATRNYHLGGYSGWFDTVRVFFDDIEEITDHYNLEPVEAVQ